MNLQTLRTPGAFPRSVQVPKRLRKLMQDRGLSVAQLLALRDRDAIRNKIAAASGLTSAQLNRHFDELDKLVPAGGGLQGAPVVIPPLCGLAAPDSQGVEIQGKGNATATFWRRHDIEIPATANLLERFRHKTVVAQQGPDCVGHGCRNAAEVFLGLDRDRLSGLFAWQYAMQETGFPIPPKGTWPHVVLDGMVKRGVCLESLHPESKFSETSYVRPSKLAIDDADTRRLETFVRLNSHIDTDDITRMMCLLIAGCPQMNLAPRPAIVGVGIPEEWLTAEAYYSGVRPVPFSEKPVGGHCFVLIGYFQHRGQLWFLGLENWGAAVGSRSPFDYPKDMGLVFIPAAFFEDPRWFWDLSIAATHEESRLFADTSIHKQDARLSGIRSRFQSLPGRLATVAGLLAVLRLLIPGDWWN